MKANSVIFPLTNPSQRLHKGRMLAGVGTRLLKSGSRGKFWFEQASIWVMSVSFALTAPSQSASRPQPEGQKTCPILIANWKSA